MKNFRKRGKHLTALLLTAAFLVMSLAACSSTADTADSSADGSEDTSDSSSEDEELKVLRIGVGGSDDYYSTELGNIAIIYGYLEEELNEVGYTAEFYTFTAAGTEINEALASGDVDAAMYGDFPAFTSKSNGIETTIIASTNQRMQYAVVSANSEVTSAQEIEGHNVVYLYGSVQQYFWENFVEAAGIDGDAVESINSTDYSSLLATGSADTSAVNIYLAAYYESLGIAEIIAEGSDYDIFTTFVVTLKNTVLEEDPDVAVAINKALIRAYETALEDPEILYEAVASETMSAEIMKTEYEWDESLWYLSPGITDDTLEYYESLNEWLYENGVISETVDIDSFVDTSYYETALAELEAEE